MVTCEDPVGWGLGDPPIGKGKAIGLLRITGMDPPEQSQSFPASVQ